MALTPFARRWTTHWMSSSSQPQPLPIAIQEDLRKQGHNLSQNGCEYTVFFIFFTFSIQAVFPYFSETPCIYIYKYGPAPDHGGRPRPSPSLIPHHHHRGLPGPPGASRGLLGLEIASDGGIWARLGLGRPRGARKWSKNGRRNYFRTVVCYARAPLSLTVANLGPSQSALFP